MVNYVSFKGLLQGGILSRICFTFYLLKLSEPAQELNNSFAVEYF